MTGISDKGFGHRALLLIFWPLSSKIIACAVEKGLKTRATPALSPGGSARSSINRLARG
jgi:hypothetical protein